MEQENIKKYDIAAYVWPSYTGDEKRTRIFWEEGIGEWQTVQRFYRKENGYEWTRRPLWGYQNEADPYVMEGQIEAALDHGVNVFIYDWYWYEHQPFLENCLNDGFLKAKNCEKMKFYLMWANHNVGMGWDTRYDDETDTLLWSSKVDRAEFELIAKRLIEKYFLHKSYYKINNKPVFSIYDMGLLIEGLGGVAQTKDALEWFDFTAKEYGLDGIHFQMIIYNEESENMSGFDGGVKITGEKLVNILGISSLTHYQFVHFLGIGITKDYAEVAKMASQCWEEIDQKYKIPYFPHISVGWDPSPRRPKTIYPHRAVNNTCENIEKALEYAKKYIDIHPEQPPLITINSWNEWTETSYIQPDNVNGYGYLEAIKKVFNNDSNG